VKNLMAVGVERYHADLLRAVKVYCLPDGESHVVPAKPLRSGPFRASSSNTSSFCERIAAAGCVGYFVSMAGKRAVITVAPANPTSKPFPARGSGGQGIGADYGQGRCVGQLPPKTVRPPGELRC